MSNAKAVFETSTEESGSSSSEDESGTAERREPVGSTAAHVFLSSEEDEAGVGKRDGIETQTVTAREAVPKATASSDISSVEESVLEESGAADVQAVDVPVPPAAVELIQQAHKKYAWQFVCSVRVYVALEVFCV